MSGLIGKENERTMSPCASISYLLHLLFGDIICEYSWGVTSLDGHPYSSRTKLNVNPNFRKEVQIRIQCLQQVEMLLQLLLGI